MKLTCALFASLLLAPLGTIFAAEAARPNVVFIFADDWGWGDLSSHGHPWLKTPHLDRLAQEGTDFHPFNVLNPVCSPSRAVFMTGQYPFHNGIVDNGERGELSHRIVTFPKLLQDAGYHTGFFGKWHMGHEDDSPRPGFDRWVSFVGQGVYFDPTLNVDGVVAGVKGYMTDILTAHAVSFIAAAPADQPFLAFIAQKAAHPEIHPNQVRSFPPAPGDEGAFAADSIRHDPSWRAPLTGKPALQRPVDTTDPRSPKGGLPDQYVRDRLRMLLAVDRGIGAVLTALEAKGVLEQTVFIVTSDQGFFYGEFGLAQERRLAYEPSTHIPLIVRYPGVVPAGVKPNALASNVDIAPTMLELGGAAVPATMDGRSLLRAWRNDSTTIRDDLLIEFYSDTEFPRVKGMGYKAVRTDRYKYIRYEELRGMDELYDLQADPYELRNLLPDRAPAGVRDDLSARLDRLLSNRRLSP